LQPSFLKSRAFLAHTFFDSAGLVRFVSFYRM